MSRWLVTLLLWSLPLGAMAEGLLDDVKVTIGGITGQLAELGSDDDAEEIPMPELTGDVPAALSPDDIGAMPLDDPTRPAGFFGTDDDDDTGTAGPSALVLQEILMAEDRKLAVINEQRVMEGDWVDGAVVIEIDPVSVLVRRTGENIELSLSGEAVKNSTEGEQEE